MEKDVLLILYVISIAQITSRGGIVSPGHCFNRVIVSTRKVWARNRKHPTLQKTC